MELPVDFPKAKKWAPRVTNIPKVSFLQLTFNVLTRATKLWSVSSWGKKNVLLFGKTTLPLKKKKEKREKCAIQEFKTWGSLAPSDVCQPLQSSQRNAEKSLHSHRRTSRIHKVTNPTTTATSKEEHQLRWFPALPADHRRDAPSGTGVMQSNSAGSSKGRVYLWADERIRQPRRPDFLQSDTA